MSAGDEAFAQREGLRVGKLVLPRRDADGAEPLGYGVQLCHAVRRASSARDLRMVMHFPQHAGASGHAPGALALADGICDYVPDV
jgi:hypothetical protein